MVGIVEGKVKPATSSVKGLDSVKGLVNVAHYTGFDVEGSNKQSTDLRVNHPNLP